MSKKGYPQVPWRTEKDPIAGHPREYEGFPVKHQWYTKESPVGSYRAIFKWGNQKEYKIPSETMYKYLEEKLRFTPEWLEAHKNFGDAPVKYNSPVKLSEKECKDLLSFVDGEGTTDDFTRLDVAYGQTMLDLMRLRDGVCENVPDIVLYPADTAQIEKIVKYCNDNKIAVYVYSGGSSVVRGFEAVSPRNVMLDMNKRCNKILEFNEKDLTLKVQPGIWGTDLETYLNNPANFNTGDAYTFGHFPQSFERSTVGGWVVTRGAGQNSSYYGKIEDLVLYQKYVTPVGTFETEHAPRKATGPDIDQIMIGNEGAYGILTEVTLKLHKLSHKHEKFAYIFPNWDCASNCMREVMQAEEGVPSVFRISDGEESELGLTMYGFGSGPLKKYLEMRGCKLGECCLMVGFNDGGEGYQKNCLKTVKRTAKKYNAVGLPGNFVVNKWSSGRFSDPYLRDNWQDFGIIIDTLECAVNWSNLNHVHDYVRKFIKSRPDTVCTCHISHPYANGANLYFIWMMKYEGYDEFKSFHSGVLNAIREAGASVSHHHGIGRLFAKYNAEQLGTVQMDILKALKTHFDPNDVMNPGGTLWLDV